jgi:hypothetical protein
MRTTTLLGMAVAVATVPGLAGASELSYTFVDFGALGVDGTATGVQSPIPGQVVEVGSGEGDGLTVSGSLAIGQRFYLSGGYESAVMDVEALVSSPLAVIVVGGSYDLIASRTAVGYVHPIGDTFDAIAEISYDTLEYDFGSFAGENFDVSEGGAGIGVGMRWNPRSTLEVFAMAHGSAVGEADLSTGEVDSGVRFSAGLRWYFFEDLGVGFRYESGDFDSMTISMRFGFGELRAGGN